MINVHPPYLIVHQGREKTLGAKAMHEKEELEQYEEDMKWLEEAKKDKASWFTRVQREAKTDQQLKV